MIAHATPTQIALHRAHKDRQARQAQMAARVRSNDNARLRLISPEPEFPMWQTSRITFDAHVTAYQLHLAKEATSTRAFIAARAKVYGLTYARITSKSRVHWIVHRRQMVILEFYEAFPRMTLGQIGRYFGGLDHSTVINACTRARQFRSGERRMMNRPMKAPPKPAKPRPTPKNKLAESVRDRIVAIWRAGNHVKAHIAIEVGVAQSTVRSVLIEMGEI